MLSRLVNILRRSEERILKKPRTKNAEKELAEARKCKEVSSRLSRLMQSLESGSRQVIPCVEVLYAKFSPPGQKNLRADATLLPGVFIRLTQPNQGEQSNAIAHEQFRLFRLFELMVRDELARIQEPASQLIVALRTAGIRVMKIEFVWYFKGVRRSEGVEHMVTAQPPRRKATEAEAVSA